MHKSPQHLAALVRYCLRFEGPRANPAMLVALEPIEVIVRDWPDDLSAMLLLQGGRAVIGLNRRHSPERRHFSFWHEVGHYLLHRASGSRTLCSLSTQGASSHHAERAADRFAVDVLMPRDWVTRLHPGASTVHDLARRFGVTTWAMSRRLGELGILAGPSTLTGRAGAARIY